MRHRLYVGVASGLQILRGEAVGSRRWGRGDGQERRQRQVERALPERLPRARARLRPAGRAQGVQRQVPRADARRLCVLRAAVPEAGRLRGGAHSGPARRGGGDGGRLQRRTREGRQVGGGVHARAGGRQLRRAHPVAQDDGAAVGGAAHRP
eukprot:6196638-Pleurochrysis_carterae.AAC.2